MTEWSRMLRKSRVMARAVQRGLARAWRSSGARERVLAPAVFAAIFALTLVSVDYLITGGPDWNPGGQAYAYQPPHQRLAPEPAATFTDYQAPPPAAPQLGDLEVADYTVSAEDLLGGPQGARFQNASYAPEGSYWRRPLLNSRPYYSSTEGRRVPSDDDVQLTADAATPKDAF